MIPESEQDRDNRNYIAKNFHEIDPKTDFDEKGNLIRPQNALDARTLKPTTIGVIFQVTDEDRLCFILENNGYKVNQASPCLWSVEKIARPVERLI